MIVDPNETLRRIRELYTLTYPTETDMVELAQKIQDLDEWLSKGGFAPADWVKHS